MKVLIAGATGAIGRPLVTQLIQAEYDVTGLTRSPQNANFLTQQGAKSEIIDIFDADAVHTTLSRIQPEVVIDLLTALPKNYAPESMSAATALDHRTRREGGANLQIAAQAAGVRRYILQSSAFWYAPGIGLADEETPFAFDSTPGIAAGTRMYADIEHRLLSANTLEGIVLRYGLFYGTGTWYASDGDMANMVRKQQFPIVGDGQGVWSWIHVEDAAAATVAAIEQGKLGIYNIVDDRPLELRVWLSAYADWLGAKPPVQVSVADTLKTQGADAVYYATQLRGASNLKAKREINFQPRSLQWLDKTLAFNL
ncbi:NAD(P)-dependent oxidoreductase [Nostoc sp. FACHB-152]|uniref:NAD-dependent epimerase/dehydratase family protein n=1 Tax=unclassified Nostoc TaxID=2593658 RepID=UPI001687A0CF|nr:MULTISPECIES: NAD(P)-dependent oxidoreductase [unclassified Nostoc]MBD2451258.1 NAD(P)-dependent oxidoreductase [Nostoc sp. FACHB-152]MBD2472447.1 NAD(P)-dependent oxidoreductase [Nostoc sp. FACHB-145]